MPQHFKLRKKLFSSHFTKIYFLKVSDAHVVFIIIIIIIIVFILYLVNKILFSIKKSEK